MTVRLPVTTARLQIDRFSDDDALAVVGIRNDPAVVRFQGWTLPYTVEQADRLIAFGRHDPVLSGAQLAIRLGDGTLVGDLMVKPTIAAHAVELGITIGSRWQNRGYATEVIRAITGALFDTDEVLKVVAVVATDNLASLRIFDRVGFRREGLTRSSFRLTDATLVDEVLFGITRTDWERPDGAFEVIAFDADDTLWQSEDGFRAAENAFVEMVSPCVPIGIDVKAALTAVERKNLHVFGYGVKAFGLSMVECATSLASAGGRGIPPDVIGHLIEMVRALLTEPVRLLPDVPRVLEAVGRTHRLVLITKGDLIHQTAKVQASGLAHHFEQIEIVMEKDPETYSRIIGQIGVPANRFLMVGNSVKSDILPVLALGGSAVHVPYHLLWDLEQAPSDHGSTFAELGSLAELPGWLSEERS
ncbi:MAG: GNAT family N-acetyltransferase [Ilumatobacteraceae bacterium]